MQHGPAIHAGVPTLAGQQAPSSEAGRSWYGSLKIFTYMKEESIVTRLVINSLWVNILYRKSPKKSYSYFWK